MSLTGNLWESKGSDKTFSSKLVLEDAMSILGIKYTNLQFFIQKKDKII